MKLYIKEPLRAKRIHGKGTDHYNGICALYVSLTRCVCSPVSHKHQIYLYALPKVYRDVSDLRRSMARAEHKMLWIRNGN